MFEIKKASVEEIAMLKKSRPSVLSYPFEKMEIGDFIDADANARQAAYMFSLRKKKYKFIARSQPDGKIRIYRVL